MLQTAQWSVVNARRLDICLKTTGSPMCSWATHTDIGICVHFVRQSLSRGVMIYWEKKIPSEILPSSSVSTDGQRRRWTWTRWRLPWCWQVSPPARWSGARPSKSTVSITIIQQKQYAWNLTAWRKIKKNSSVKLVNCMFCFTFHSTAVILWMHAEAQADKLPPPAVL